MSESAETLKPVDELSFVELLDECANWMSDMNSAYWEARSDWAPSENRGRALFCRLYETANKIRSGEVALARFLTAPEVEKLKVNL